MNDYRYRGAKAMVELHERYLREFLDVWRDLDERQVTLPSSPDPNYASREKLLAHVLGCAARYLGWICEKIGEDPPGLEERPDPEGLRERAGPYLESVLRAWRGPALRNLTEAQAEGPVHASRWGTPYCVDAMLEHAVMHPIRHAHQLRGLIPPGTRSSSSPSP